MHLSLLVNPLNGDALYSRSDPSDRDMVIETKPLLYEDHDCHLDLSCSEEDDLEALTFIFRYLNYQTKPGIS